MRQLLCWRTTWCLFGALMLAAPAVAQEEILQFHSAVEMASNGALTVTETITVRSEGQQIRRGIFRDFPILVEIDGANRQVGFEVVSVERDGSSEPYRIERFTRYVRVYIGRADRILSPGVYSYRLRYTTDRQIRFFDNYDELSWNATGNAWDFPIRQATANVYMPEGARLDDTVAYTGPQGSTAQNATMEVTPDRRMAAFATDNLGRHEGLTVGVKFAKGIIEPPSAAQRAAWFWRDFRGEIIGFGGLLLATVYYLWAWITVGRDPKPGVIVPRWDAPPDLSPALTNYIDKKGIGARPWDAMSAALLNLAVQGHLELTDLGGDISMKLTGAPLTGKLPVGEQSLYSSLLGNGGTLVVNSANGTTVQKTARAFRKAMSREHRNNFYRRNPLWVAGGVLLSLFCVAGIILSMMVLHVLNAAILVVGLLALNISFIFLLGAPTPAGRKMMDHIKGLKTYIKLAESDRLNLQGAPKMSPQHFETILPYAVALGLEKPWTKAFEMWLATAAAAVAASYAPMWYHGGSFRAHTFSDSLGSLSSRMGESFTASLPVPKSSSSGFSGGGGSSGGGGGGGGGGGW